jgi:hypothetical protein
MTVLKRTIRGIRDSIPSGFIMGRLSSGNGPAELISLRGLSQAQSAAGGSSGGGSSGGVSDFGFFFSGKPLGSQIMFEIKMTKSLRLPLNLGGSQFNAATPPAADWTVTLLRNGSSIGTIKFAATTGATTVTFATSVTFVIGDIFKITAPGTADSALADIAFSFASTFL